MHKSEDELKQLLTDAAQQVQVHATYKHYKGDRYIVIGLAIQEVDDLPCVIYQAQYGKNITFTRALASWLETVEWQGQTLPRFSPVID